MEFIINLLTADIRISGCILIAAMGLVFSARSGVVNLGAEGVMLIGAFAGYAGPYYFGGAWGGVFVSALVGILIGLLFAFLVVTVAIDQTIVGTALNILGIGVSTTLYRLMFGINSTLPEVETFGEIAVPILSDIPVLGSLLFKHNILLYLAWILVFLSHFVMFKTELGLKIRAVGENPQACDTLGINVYYIRYGTILYSTMLCSIAGTYMSLAQLSVFTEEMIAGRGYIALAAVVFGKWKPRGVFIAVLVFALGDALQLRLRALNTEFPYEFLLMLPYILTIIALMGVVGKDKSSAPAATGLPYIKE